jgi:hypothetical protein
MWKPSTPAVRALVAIGAAAAAIAVPTGTAFADSGGAHLFGACAAGSTFELIAGPANGEIRIGFKVSTPFSDRNWTTVVSDNGVPVFTDTQFLAGGGFSYDVHTVDRPGTDTITVDSAFGPVACHGSVTV